MLSRSLSGCTPQSLRSIGAMEVNQGNPGSLFVCSIRCSVKDSGKIADKLIMDVTLNFDVIQKYPWLGKFGTKTEIDDYLAGNKVQCLLCGKLFKALPQHLERTHEITADDFREQYGLPWKR